MADHRKSKITAVDLTTLTQLSRAELVERWIQAHRHPPPKGLSRRLLEFSVAYQLQTKIMGGLTPTVRRKLQRRVSIAPSNLKNVDPTNKSTTLTPGSRLLRDWHGQTYAVEVLEDGFLHDGHRYSSLSKVASAITGARWSGPRFFGL